MTDPCPHDDIGRLPTEQPNAASARIDRLDTLSMLRIINDQDRCVADAVGAVLEDVARAVDLIVERMRRGGRLFYIGAGSSGRLGILDAAEMPPTYGIDPQKVQGIIAGGPEAVFTAREGAEDDAEAGREDLDARGVGAADVLVGISASGRAPYVLEALRAARERGAATVALCVNPGAAVARCAEIAIVPQTGPEVITGSTRMKAGSAQKMVLNMLSTGAMIRLGRVQGNRMVDLTAKCEKLRRRAIGMVAQMTGSDEAAAERALAQCGYSVREASRRLEVKSDLPQRHRDTKKREKGTDGKE